MSRCRPTLFLLLSAFWSVAGAAPSRPADLPPRGVTVTRNAAQTAVPTLNLLVTVRLLADLTARGTLTFGATAGAALREDLRGLGSRPDLGPLAAQQVQDRLLASLTDPQRAALAQARADLDRRAQLLMARARFATPDGPVNSTLAAYGFEVPGGLPLVLRLSKQPSLNPYLDSGPNTAVLRRLLETLEH